MTDEAVDLDDLDRRILNAIQDDLPIVAEPFAGLARSLGIDVPTLLGRMERMREARVITRFGPFYDAAAMGGAFCLCAMAVPEERFEAVVEQVNAWAEVAHNYRRTHRLNMWFVLATETPEEIGRVAEMITGQTGIEVMLFPKLEEFFIGFRVAA
jgi:siroheme decarboxylase